MAETTPLWIDHGTTPGGAVLLLTDPSGHYEAQVGWDGCIHFYEYGAWHDDGRPIKDDDGTQYLHICGSDDLERLIDQLIALRDRGREHFQDRESSIAADAWQEGKRALTQSEAREVADT